VARHILLKSFQGGLRLCFRPHLNRRSSKEFMGFQSYKSPKFGNLGLPFGNLGTKWHLGASFVTRHRVYNKGEGGDFLQVWAMVSLVSPCLPMAHPCTKSAPAYALTNLLFGLCRSVWIIELLVNLPSPHFGALARPFTPKVLWAKERTPILKPSTIFTLDSHLSLSRSLGARHP